MSDLGSGTSSKPAEVLEIVLESVLCFLTSNEDRNAASLVCKSWYEVERLTRSDVDIVNCKAVSPRRVIDRFQGRVTSVTIKGRKGWLSSLEDCGVSFAPWLKSMTKAYRWLEKVYLKGMTVTDVDLGVLARSFPDLKELILVRCRGFVARGLGIVASECKLIKVFELIDSFISADDDYDLISCFPESNMGLESLLVGCVSGRTNFEALERLVKRSPSLKKLSFSSDLPISVSELHRLIVRAPQLTHLGIGIFAVGVEEQGDDYGDLAAAFAACKALEYLFGFVPDYLRAIVPVCANLKLLDFTQTEINDAEFESVVFHCSQLQSLHVSDSVGDEGLKAVAATCKDLRELRLREWSVGRVSEVGMLAIFKGCQRLQYIQYDCREMTNATLVAMSKSCPDLHVFRISVRVKRRANFIPGEPLDEGIGAIVKNCKKITRLEACCLLTDRAFQYIGEYGKLLRSLSFDFTGDSDMGLKYVLEGCTKLQKLEIINCPFGDLALSAGSHHYYSMKLFLCMKSGRVTRAGCAQIAQLLLEKFGVEAHVMLYMSPRRPTVSHGNIKIYLKR